jgi:hypothetical protein
MFLGAINPNIIIPAKTGPTSGPAQPDENSLLKPSDLEDMDTSDIPLEEEERLLQDSPKRPNLRDNPKDFPPLPKPKKHRKPKRN